MIINILAGGPESLLPDLSSYATVESVWLGVDKGVFTLLESGIAPDYAFGDFDSVTEKEWEVIEQRVRNLKKFSPEKDETDMELAINWALEQSPKQINLFGATGGRLDHMFGNVQLLLKPALANLPSEIQMIDKQNHVFAKPPGTYSLNELAGKKYISFVPVTPSVKGLTLEGFKYPLVNCDLPIGSTLCISNELLNDYGTFSFSEGILLVVRSGD
ncbi:thiamine diphosphokinase [Mesobacillus foraminis]|uniref:thiamine diphosphokinase n=1 Tax=Mesobacillus foraminis TaxID=279826 RepID=UPI001BE80682|nr:thiamine diphosphokinase [Mesobacillus foraminis]MBT2756058.1 thiamine diphosphokinase [Mesobacillus foraminis]